MARAVRREVVLFNFSFLDILATTIGVIIFIMVLALLNASNRVSLESLEKKREELEQAAAKSRSDAEKWKDLAEKERQTAADYGARPAAESRVTNRDVQELEQQGRELDGQFATLSEEGAALSNRVASLERAVGEAKQATPPGGERAPQSIQYRLPVERETDKRPAIFEVDGQGVLHLLTHGNLDTDNYTAFRIGDAVVVFRSKDVRPETLAEALRPGSRFKTVLRDAPASQYYLSFLVRPQGYAIFRGFRQKLWDAGYEINWSAYAEDEQMIFGASSGEGQGTVRGRVQ